VDALAALAPREVRYVSCDPGTLARDLRRFTERGFALRSLCLLDLFPQTLHVETIAVLAPA
jgi:23S rRNA (uracil1939-C5)-methyltransferase